MPKSPRGRGFKRELLPKCLRGGLLWWEIIPKGVLVKLSKREKMPVRKRCQGEKYVLANEHIFTSCIYFLIVNIVVNLAVGEASWHDCILLII